MGSDLPYILIVDDEPFIRDLLLTTISPHYNCATASEVGEAMDLLRSNHFDLVLADEGLPGCSGLAICLYAQAAAPDTRVIMISGKTDEQSIEKAKRMGAYDYVCKPFDLSEVKQLLERALSHLTSDAA